MQATLITSLRGQWAASDLLLLDTDTFIGQLEKTPGRVLRRRKPGLKKKNGTREVWCIRNQDKFMIDFGSAGTYPQKRREESICYA